MLKLAIVVASLIAMPAAAADRAWTKTDYTLEALSLSLITIDIAQTMSFTQERSYQKAGFYETNPIVGKHPSRDKVRLMFVSSVVGHTAVSALLPKPWRTVWQALTISASGLAVTHNFVAGARLTIPW